MQFYTIICGMFKLRIHISTELAQLFIPTKPPVNLAYYW